VGRERELSAIIGYFTEVASESEARAVTVIAEAGVGKSRLAVELLRRLEAHTLAPEIIVARCESFREHTPFAAIAAALSRATGVEWAPTAAERAEMLGRRLDDDRITDPVTRELLGELLGVSARQPSEAVRAARENPALMFERLRGAWLAWLSALVERRPLLLVIEDIHWADESSLLLVDASLAALAEERLMVLALGRPEARARRAWGARQPHELKLDPLSRRTSERLVRDALGPAATESIVSAVVGRAAGNALFLEELVRAVAHDRTDELPVGVIGTVQRRFDALHPEARAVLRAASIFGERFTADGVAALVPSGIGLAAALNRLVEEELVTEQPDGYAFRHALVREGAYALLTDDDRALGHAIVAQMLQDSETREAAVIAQHFELGRKHDEAARWYAAAAAGALGRNDLAGALAHAARAQRWMADADELGKLDLVVAEAEFWLGALDRARVAAERALGHLPAGSAPWFEAVGLIITAAGQVGDNDAVELWLRNAMDMPPEQDAASSYVLCLSRGCSQLAWDRIDIARPALARAEAVPRDAIGPRAIARLEFARGYVFWHDGRIDACQRVLSDVIAIYQRLGSAREALQMRMLAYMLGNYTGGIETGAPGLLQLLEEAVKLDAAYLARWARWGLAIAHLVRADRDAARRELEQVTGIIEGQPLFFDVTAQFRAWAAFACDDVDELASVIEQASGALTYERFKASMACFAAHVRARRGDLAGGVDDARRALVTLSGARGLLVDGCMVGFSPALATLVAAGDPDAAQQIGDHVRKLHAIRDALDDDTARVAFFEHVPWNRHVLQLAERLGCNITA
jgi:hypothetical protein